MLDGAPPDAHQVWVALHPIIHLIDKMFVLPAGDAALLAGRTARLERAILTIILPVTPMHQASLFAGIAVGQLPSGRAGVAINLGVVDKVGLHVHALLAVAGGVRSRHCGGDAILLTGEDLHPLK